MKTHAGLGRWIGAGLGALGYLAVAGCGGAAPDVRYPAREAGCAVRGYPARPVMIVDELGSVQVECRAPGAACERQLFDAVCARGGDVAWGLGADAFNDHNRSAHAAHSHRESPGRGERGCSVEVVAGDAPERVENIGPVTAYCAEDDTREACLRELQDQACLLGGNLLWQVEGPAPEATSNGMRQRMRGRAAHTK